MRNHRNRLLETTPLSKPRKTGWAGMGPALMLLSTLFCLLPAGQAAAESGRPNMVLFMTDDQGWGDVGYNGHAVLKTPTLDAMAATALRLDRFYAAAPVCSPTRGSVLTGRHPNRYGCFSWGHTLRPEEVTLAEQLQEAGYRTGHFGKWHLGSVAADSPVSPGRFGFERWFSAPNFFELDPKLSHEGTPVQIKGESSQVLVDLALEFIREAAVAEQPFLAVVWFGSPHTPHVALPEDRALYADQPENVQHYLGELTAMDRAVGHLRDGLRDLGIAENTLIWFTSDNGAAPPGSNGGLRGRKGTLWEGGIRVPTVLEWPARFARPAAVDVPCGTVDIYPTLLRVAGLEIPEHPALDGIDLLPILEGELRQRPQPMGFWVYPAPGRPARSGELLDTLARRLAAGLPGYDPDAEGPIDPDRRYPRDERPGHSVWMDNAYKLHRIPEADRFRYALFDLAADPSEEHDLAAAQTERMARMKVELAAWQEEVIDSLNRADYTVPTSSDTEPQARAEK